MLTLKHVNKYYTESNNFHALKDINLHVEAGEFVAILGESGSGKSTLLNVISGLDTYQSGDIVIGGVSTQQFNKKEWAIYRNHYVGFVFQEYNLVDHLTIVENVELPLLLQGVSAKEARKRALEKCQLLGLKNHTHKIPQKVSGGQQQRAAIARALVTEPKVILADEPTGALDSENATIILEILKKLSKTHVVILVTHDEEYANTYASRIVKLEDGKIISDTNPNEVKYQINNELNLKRPNMKAKVLFKFARNNIGKRKFRTLFTSATMSIGLISIFLIIFLVNGIRTEVTNFVYQLIPKDQYMINSEVRNADLNQEHLDLVRELDEIDEAYFQYTLYPYLNREEGNYQDEQGREIKYYERSHYTLTGIPSKRTNFNYKNDLVGRYPKSENEIIVTSKLVEKLININNINQKDLQDAFEMVQNETITIERISLSEELNEEFTIVGIIYGNGQDVFALNSKLEQLHNSLSDDDKVIYEDHPDLDPFNLNRSHITVYLNVSKSNAIEKLENTLYDEGLVLRNPVKMVYGSINQFFDTVLAILVGTAAVSLVVSGILVGLMVYISVIERVKEIGILTSIGARASNIRNLFIFESGFIGLLSSFIALLIALLLTLLINSIFNNTIGAIIRGLNIAQLEGFKLLHIDTVAIILVFFVSIFYAVLCGLIPAFLASRLKAIEALRKE